MARGVTALALSLIFSFSSAIRVFAVDDIDRIPSADLRAGGDDMKRYFLIGPMEEAKAPTAGYKLLIVLPGGAGGSDFNPFVRRIALNALGSDYLVAQLVAPVWDPKQGEQIVWPTKTSPWTGMRFSTEEFVDAVVDEVCKSHTIDSRCIFTLSWSSGGPAAFATSLRKKSPVTGSFIAMSVFFPSKLPALKHARGHAYYLYQSPDDQICRMHFAKTAKTKLSAKRARVKLVEYSGGHGWHGDVFGSIRTGIKWLEKNAGKAPPKADASNGEKKKKGKTPQGDQDSDGSKTKNLIENGGFEHGVDGWMILNNSGRAEISVTKDHASQGKHSLHIKKAGGMPMDVVRLNIDSLPKAGRVRVSAMVRSEEAVNSFFKFFIYDGAGESLTNDVDVARVTGTGDWKRIEKTFRLPKDSRSAAVMFVMVMGGEVWLDDIRVEEVGR